jgi:hypothetical protein
MSKKFLEINYNTSKIVESINSFLPDTLWGWVPYMVIAKNFNEIAEKICDEDKELLNPLSKEFNGQLKLYKFPSNSFYQWHTDTDIGVSINMVLDHYNSHTLFGNGYENLHTIKVEELVYTPKKFYLFNSQKYHTVVNLDSRDRILVSFIFDRSISYDMIKEWLVDKKII